MPGTRSTSTPTVTQERTCCVQALYSILSITIIHMTVTVFRHRLVLLTPDSLHEYVGGNARNITSKTSHGQWEVKKILSLQDKLHCHNSSPKTLREEGWLEEETVVGFEVKRPSFRPWFPRTFIIWTLGEQVAAAWGALQVLTRSALTTTQWREFTHFTNEETETERHVTSKWGISILTPESKLLTTVPYGLPRK